VIYESVNYDVKDLSWPKDLARWSDDQRKVLIALSHRRFPWRTNEGLRAATGLEQDALEAALADLIHEKVVRPFFSKNMQLIYGLLDRVGT
jgi:hypothetical protein